MCLNLPMQLYRRKIADMIQVFKIMKGIDDVHIEDFFFQVSDTSTRGHDLKIYKPRCNKSIRQHSFSLRVIEEWNSLPEVFKYCIPV